MPRKFSIPSDQPEHFVGISAAQFEAQAGPIQVHRQRKENWCWAACIQMVFNFHGMIVTQEQIVGQLYGRLLDRTAQPEDILLMLYARGPNIWGGGSRAHPDDQDLDNTNILAELEAGKPLIVGLEEPDGSGHAYVLTGAYTQVDESARPQLSAVMLRNPYPGTPGSEVLSIEEFDRRCTFATRVQVDRLNPWKR